MSRCLKQTVIFTSYSCKRILLMSVYNCVPKYGCLVLLYYHCMMLLILLHALILNMHVRADVKNKILPHTQMVMSLKSQGKIPHKSAIRAHTCARVRSINAGSWQCWWVNAPVSHRATRGQNTLIGNTRFFSLSLLLLRPRLPVIMLFAY